MILIKNGRVIDHKSQRDENIDLIIKENKIYKRGVYEKTCIFNNCT